MMSRYAVMFERLARRREGALIPFLMLGDPDPNTCLVQVDAVVAGGADALELGFPFSDPVADGPTLVAAANRARAAGAGTNMCFELLARIRARHPDLPVGILVYANLVIAQGIDAFYARAGAAGVDSVLVPDVPLRESEPFRGAAERHAIAPVFILPPDADADVLQRVAAASRGYTYVLGRRGVTGVQHVADAELDERLALLKAANAAPPIIGFGISKPEHVSAAIASGASGVVVGSRLVDSLANGGDLKTIVTMLKSATCGPR